MKENTKQITKTTTTNSKKQHQKLDGKEKFNCVIQPVHYVGIEQKTIFPASTPTDMDTLQHRLRYKIGSMHTQKWSLFQLLDKSDRTSRILEIWVTKLTTSDWLVFNFRQNIKLVFTLTNKLNDNNNNDKKKKVWNLRCGIVNKPLTFKFI